MKYVDFSPTGFKPAYTGSAPTRAYLQYLVLFEDVSNVRFHDQLEHFFELIQGAIRHSSLMQALAENDLRNAIQELNLFRV